jgi:hypothetical protein
MKRKIRKDVITKFVIQAIAVFLGIFSLVGIYLCVHLAVTFVWERDEFPMSFIIPMLILMLLIEVVTVAIAYQNIRHFGPNSIKNMTGLAAFYLYCILISHVGPYLTATRESMMQGLLSLAAFLILILLAYFFYLVVSRKLIQLTETKNIQQDAKPDDENGAVTPLE